jgi:hypothetical protein
MKTTYRKTVTSFFYLVSGRRHLYSTRIAISAVSRHVPPSDGSQWRIPELNLQIQCTKTYSSRRRLACSAEAIRID